MKNINSTHCIPAQHGTYKIELTDSNDVHKEPVIAWVTESGRSEYDVLFVTALPVCAGYSSLETNYEFVYVLFPDGSIKDVYGESYFYSIESWIQSAIEDRDNMLKTIRSKK